jgi:uncharacterized membrane protein
MILFLTDDLLLYIREFIGALGVAVICLGALRSVYQLARLLLHETYTTNYIRLQFADNIILGLEFMVGADIIGSLVSPNYYKVGLLAIIVLVRTWLSFFLSRELQSLTPGQREHIRK